MDLDKIAQAFAAGFTVGRAMAMDAARDSEEDGHWVTIGAEAGPDGEKHGGRPVFIKGAGAKSAKTESKPTKTESKSTKTESKSTKTESKPTATKGSRKADFNLPIRDFMQKTKFRPGTFAAEWMQKAPDGADTLDLLTENMSEDCQYLLKHTMEVVQYEPITGRLKPDESEAFYSHDRCVNFPLAFFHNAAPRNRYKTSYEIIMHELGHAVDHIAGVKAGGGWITVNATLKNAITHDTNQLIDEQREAVRKKLDASEREKDRLIKIYMRRNPDAKRPTPRELVDFGVAEAIREWAQRSDEGWYGAMSGASDMISAVTLNKIKDGGTHKTSYWKSGEYNMNTEFMAHYFETCNNRDTKKTFAKIFPTATKVLEILIEDTAKGLRQKEKRK